MTPSPIVTMVTLLAVSTRVILAGVAPPPIFDVPALPAGDKTADHAGETVSVSADVAAIAADGKPVTNADKPIAVDVAPPTDTAVDIAPPTDAAVDFVPPTGPEVDIITHIGPAVDVAPSTGPVVDVAPPSDAAVDVAPHADTVVDVAPLANTAVDVVPPTDTSADVAPPTGSAVDVAPPVDPSVDVAQPTDAVGDSAPPTGIAAPSDKAAADPPHTNTAEGSGTTSVDASPLDIAVGIPTTADTSAKGTPIDAPTDVVADTPPLPTDTVAGSLPHSGDVLPPIDAAVDVPSLNDPATVDEPHPTDPIAVAAPPHKDTAAVDTPHPIDPAVSPSTDHKPVDVPSPTTPAIVDTPHAVDIDIAAADTLPPADIATVDDPPLTDLAVAAVHSPVIDVQPPTDLVVIDTAPPTDPTGADAPPPTDPIGVDAPPPIDTAGVDVPHLTDTAGLDVPPLTDTAGVDVPPLTDTAGVDVPPLTDIAGVDLLPLTGTAGVDVRFLADTVGVDVPPLTDNAGVDVPHMADTASVNVPPLTDTAGVDALLLTDTAGGVHVPPVIVTAGVDVPLLTDTAGVDVPLQTETAGVDVPRLTDTAGVDIPLLTDTAGVDVPLLTDIVGVDIPLLTDTAGVDVPLLTGTAGVDVPLLTDTAGVDVPLLTDTAGVDVPRLTDTAGVDVPLLIGTAGVDVPLLTDTSGVNVPLLTGTAGVDVPLLTDTAGVDVPPLTDTAGVDVLLLTDTAGVDVPLLTGTAGVNVPLLTGTAGIDVPLLTDTAGVNVPLLTGTAGVDVPLLTDTAGVDVPPMTDTAGVNVPPLADTAKVDVPPLTDNAGVDTPPPIDPTGVDALHPTDKAVDILPIDKAVDTLPPIDISVHAPPPIDTAIDAPPSIDTSVYGPPPIHTAGGVLPRIEKTVDAPPAIDTGIVGLPPKDTSVHTLPTIGKAFEAPPSIDTVIGGLPPIDTTIDALPAIDKAVVDAPPPSEATAAVDALSPVATAVDDPPPIGTVAELLPPKDSIPPVDTAVATLPPINTHIDAPPSILLTDKQFGLPTSQSVDTPLVDADHPPPIFVPGAKYQHKLVSEDPSTSGTVGSLPAIDIHISTTIAPPPPIIVPQRPENPDWQNVQPSVVSPSGHGEDKQTPPQFYRPPVNDPRFMSVSELAELSLMNLERKLQRERESWRNRHIAYGLQVFFKPPKPIIPEPTTTPTLVLFETNNLISPLNPHIDRNMMLFNPSANIEKLDSIGTKQEHETIRGSNTKDWGLSQFGLDIGSLNVPKPATVPSLPPPRPVKAPPNVTQFFDTASLDRPNIFSKLDTAERYPNPFASTQQDVTPRMASLHADTPKYKPFVKSEDFFRIPGLSHLLNKLKLKDQTLNQNQNVDLGPLPKKNVISSRIDTPTFTDYQLQPQSGAYPDKQSMPTNTQHSFTSPQRTINPYQHHTQPSITNTNFIHMEELLKLSNIDIPQLDTYTNGFNKLSYDQIQTADNIGSMSNIDNVSKGHIHVGGLQQVMTPKVTIATTTHAPTTIITTTVKPTAPATVEPHPPAIFDTKVVLTFMPFPKMEPTTKPNFSGNSKPGDNETKTGGNKVTSNDPCSGCIYVNERCLLPHYVHCHMYTECVRQGSFIRSFTRTCAMGSFFDRKKFLCVDPKNTDCPTDRCREPGLKAYSIFGQCKHYWVCGAREGGSIFAQSECCPDNGGFKDGVGCVADPNCTDSCHSKIDRSPPAACDCDPGTMNGTNCTCGDTSTLGTNPTGGMCQPMLKLTFDGATIEDKSRTKQHIGIEGVPVSKNGEAIFNGDGRLVLWRYANLMFTDVFAMSFRFQNTQAGPRYQTLVSNCNKKSGQEPSFDIKLDTVYNEVIFSVNTYQSQAKTFKIYYQLKTWVHVEVIYDGERIVGSVDGRVRNILSAGGIETRPNPLAIGGCGGKGGLKGFVDDIYIYEECIPDDMYGTFVSVLE